MLSPRGMLVVSAAVLAAALGLLLAGTPPGNAAFPGANGRIAYICTPDGMEICLVNPDGSGLGYLTQYDRQGENFDERYPVWSPDGRRLAFVVVGFCVNEIYVMNADRTGLRRVLHEPGRSEGMWTIQDVSWSPDGTRLALAKTFYQGQCPMGMDSIPSLQQIFTIAVDGTNQRPITDGGRTGRDMEPAWSPDGGRIAFVRELSLVPFVGLNVMSPDGSSRRVLDERGRGSPDWSPDGSRIAYECVGPEREELCVYTEGGGIRRVGAGSSPAWSPDGRQLVFAVQPGQGDPGIYVMNADGTGRREIVPETGYADGGPGHPTWQPCRGPCPPAPGLPSFLKRPTPPTPLYANVGPGFTISLRNKARRPVKTLVEGRYNVRVSDRSRHHSFHVVGQKGRFQPRTTVRGTSRGVQQWVLTPGTYRFFCDAHPRRERGTFRVIPDPRGRYRP
jgi:Tol biopolymer transport system component